MESVEDIVEDLSQEQNRLAYIPPMIATSGNGQPSLHSEKINFESVSLLHLCTRLGIGQAAAAQLLLIGATHIKFVLAAPGMGTSRAWQPPPWKDPLMLPLLMMFHRPRVLLRFGGYGRPAIACSHEMIDAFV